MSKIVCDICGTTYPDTADCCPICGCSRDSAMEFLGDAYEAEEILDDSRKGRYAGKKRKEIFDYDEVNPQLDETVVLDEDPEEETQEKDEGGSGTNTGVIVGLTVLIASLLLAVGFLFVKFILPSVRGEDPKPKNPIVQQTEAPAEDSNFIPCQYITISSGGAKLTAEGQYFLLNVVPTPEDTTDTIYYAIEDESVATVSDDGKITAVSEGETTVYITCGNQQITCPVTVKYEEETEPTTEATEAPVETEAQVEATVAPTQSSLKNVTLKLKKTDIMLGIGYKVQLALDCDLSPSEVEWSVEHDHIASVDEEGWVKALKYGTTSVTAKYGDQEVKCMVRCG